MPYSGIRSVSAALATVSFIALVGAALIYRARDQGPQLLKEQMEILTPREVVPLKYMYRPVLQSLRGGSEVRRQKAASVGFQPGVSVDYPGYLPPGDPRNEGSDAMTHEPWARDAQMRKRAGWDVGETGWEPGPDYYSTRKYDNLPVYPSSRDTGSFRPYMGPTGCANCETTPIDGTYVFSTSATCDLSVQTKNVKGVLKPYDPFTGSAFENQRYEDLVWTEQQLQMLTYFFKKLTILIPPCFLPHFSNKALAKLDDMVYARGTNLLIVGGHSGADFISRFLAGDDSYGYVKSGHRDEYSLPKSRIDVVWTEGPFVMQEAAVTTEFYYGHRILRNVGNCIVGVPVKDLPANTKHYYMDQNENSVIFEIPAGHGRVLFFGYDMCSMVPEWIDTLLLAQSELTTSSPIPPAPLLPPAPTAAPSVHIRLPDMPTGLNYYCAVYKRNLADGAPAAELAKYLTKCQGQDCNNNRVLDQNEATSVVDFCKWTDENGFCYLAEPAMYCYKHPDDTRCYCAESCGPARAAQYKYDPTCGKGYDSSGYDCYGSQCGGLGFEEAVYSADALKPLFSRENSAQLLHSETR